MLVLLHKNGFISSNENIILVPKLYIEILQLKIVVHLHITKVKNIFLDQKAKVQLNIVKINAVFWVSVCVNCPLSNKSFIIKSLKIIPIAADINNNPNKIKDDFFISFNALASSLFFIARATIGNKAIDAIAKIAEWEAEKLYLHSINMK